MKSHDVPSPVDRQGVAAQAQPGSRAQPATDSVTGIPLKVSSLAVDIIVAAMVSGVAVLIRWFLDPWVGGQFPFATLLCANAIAAWYRGYRPGLLTAR